MSSNSEGCPWPVNLSGNNITVDGGITAAGSINLQPGGGPDAGGGTILGDVEYGGDDFNYNPDKVTFNPAAPDSPSGDIPDFEPSLFRIEDYAPGSAIASHIDALGDYWHYPAREDGSAVQLPKDRMDGEPEEAPLTGVYFISGDVRLNQAVVEAFPDPDQTPPPGLKGLTIIATGDISISSNVKNQTFWHYQALKTITTYELLLFSGTNDGGCNSSGGIRSQGSENTYRGIWYAPGSNIDLSGSDNWICGALIAQSVSPSGADSLFQRCECVPAPGRQK